MAIHPVGHLVSSIAKTDVVNHRSMIVRLLREMMVDEWKMMVT